MPAEVRRCPLCDRDNSGAPPLPYAEPPWQIKQCAGCGLVYLENPPPYESLEKDFAWEQTWAAEKQLRRQREPLLYWLAAATDFFRRQVFKRDKLTPLARRYLRCGPILDVGCGDGCALDRLPPEFIPHGIEVSKTLHALADARFRSRGGRCIRADALSGMREFPPAFFDGIVMCSFLEHERNPRAALESASALLNPGARLILKVPNYASWNRVARGARWCGFRSPDHVNYFTPKSLTRLLTDCGFRVVRFGWLDRSPSSDNMWLVAEH